jgi:hypothetical protein
VASAQNFTADYSGLRFQPSYANGGVRSMGANGDQYWRDEHGLPTWVQVDFSGAKVINELDVITARDDYATQNDPGAPRESRCPTQATWALWLAPRETVILCRLIMRSSVLRSTSRSRAAACLFPPVYPKTFST